MQRVRMSAWGYYRISAGGLNLIIMEVQFYEGKYVDSENP